ncbi:MAG: DNA primase [Chloracidobacterium sp.]|nr:DNA primase [Chloracidobacterium sp.]
MGNLFHLDTLDLYQARARANFAQIAAKHCRVNESVINADLLSLIETLEAERLSMRKTSTNEAESTAAMTEAEKREAIAFLKDEKLCERIVEDFRRCGLVGERSTVLTAYLGSISRKLTEPLALLIVARSGAGKSALQDALCAFVPPEELVRVTRLTGQALFYKDPYSLQRKMLVIAEDEGAMQAVYSLRTLASDQRLSIAATRTDPATGKLSTEHYEVFGPVVIVITTTSAEAFDEETRSRFVQLSMNESIEQTRIILSQQRHQHSLSGVLEKAESEEIKRLHHHAQRMLKPLAVVNPFVEHLTYPSERLIHRREQRKYLSLINSIALLHQYQREIKTAKRGEIEIEYVEVELSDIALANELAEEILGKAMDELAPPVRGMFEAIREACKRRAEELKIKACDVQLTRREIRETTAWSDWQVRMYCQKLVEMEYLWAIQAVNGKPSVYQLASDAESEVQSLRGLTGVDELKTRLKDAAKEKAASR